jgi:hypothetical protein
VKTAEAALVTGDGWAVSSGECLEVGSCAEHLPRAGQDRDPGGVVRLEFTQRRDYLAANVEIDRVPVFGAVQRNGGYTSIE